MRYAFAFLLMLATAEAFGANAADTFNRANATINGATASDGVHVWTTRVGTWAVLSNQADPDATVNGRATLNTDCADADVSIKVATIQGANHSGVILRWSDDSNFLLGILTTTSVLLRKCEAGVFTNIATASVTGVSGDAIRVHTVGDQVSVYHTPNGGAETQVIAAQTVTFNQTATVHGMYASGSSAFKLDDFAVTDLGGGGGSAISPLASSIPGIAAVDPMRGSIP